MIDQLPTRILFLDIDGVLNSTKTAIAFGHYPFKIDEQHLFDQCALALIRGLCEAGNVSICLSSSWRHDKDWKNYANALDLPIFDRTGVHFESRGHEIAEWLQAHPEVETYAIVDDDADMLDEQKPFFVQTSHHDGLTFKDFSALCEIFGIQPYDCQRKSQ